MARGTVILLAMVAFVAVSVIAMIWLRLRIMKPLREIQASGDPAAFRELLQKPEFAHLMPAGERQKLLAELDELPPGFQSNWQLLRDRARVAKMTDEELTEVLTGMAGHPPSPGEVTGFREAIVNGAFFRKSQPGPDG